VLLIANLPPCDKKLSAASVTARSGNIVRIYRASLSRSPEINVTEIMSRVD
jgi:hypothetical protein